MDEKGLKPIGSTITRVNSVDDLVDESYTLVSGTNFNVRVPPDYPRNKLKGPSEESLLTVLGFDIFRTPRKLIDIMSKVAIPDHLPDLRRLPEDKGLYIPKVLCVNFMLPAYAPESPLWGSPKADGDSYHVVIYYAITQSVYEDIIKETTNAHKLLKRWLQVHPTDPKDYELRGRLKAIPFLLNPQDANLGLLSSMVNMYNSKPFLTGPKFHSFIKTENYMEVDVDIHRYQYLARSTFHGLVSEIENMELWFGVVVEGKQDDELPECMLGAVHISHLRISSAVPFE